MPITIDLALIIFIIISISLACKKGFVYSLITFIGYVFAAVLSFSLARAGAGWLTNGYFRTSLAAKIAQQLTSGANSLTQAVNNSIPEFLSKLLGLTETGLREIADKSGTGISEAIYDKAIAPTIFNIINFALVALLISLLFYLVRRIAHGAKRLVRRSFLDIVDRLLGAGLGLLKANVIIIVTMYVIKVLMFIGNGSLLGLTKQAIDSSMLFRFYYIDLLSLG